jgi:lipoyl(octanoyl) transferase
MERRRLDVSYLGRVAYADGLRLQEDRVEAVRAGVSPEALFLLEHDPVITLGRNAHGENVVASAETLERLGITVAECGRGGDVTYHGPGQLVGYPIVNLAPDRKDVWKYVRNLEEALIRTLAAFGIEGGRKEGLTGVWVGPAKVAAIGVRVSRWITSHGFALNVTTDLEHFKTIVPCGIRNYGVTSLERLLAGEAPPLPRVAERFAARFAELFDREAVWAGGLSPAGPRGSDRSADGREPGAVPDPAAAGRNVEVS